MLPLVIPEREFYNSQTKEFIHIKATTLSLEHSLISLSRWEAQYKKPFLDKKKKTVQETVDYIRCMTVTANVDPNVYLAITDEMVLMVENYIQDPMTATWFNDREERRFGSQTITSELIYYWMVELGIPFECQKWHLNRLMTLIRVCTEKRKKPRKMGRREQARSNAALNAARRRAHNSRG